MEQGIAALRATLLDRSAWAHFGIDLEAHSEIQQALDERIAQVETWWPLHACGACSFLQIEHSIVGYFLACIRRSPSLAHALRSQWLLDAIGPLSEAHRLATERSESLTRNASGAMVPPFSDPTPQP